MAGQRMCAWTSTRRDSPRLRDGRWQAERGGGEYLGRYVLPGMPNLHSHAFQRAMAGLAERRRQCAHA